MVLSSTLTDIGFVDAAVVALLGYAVVFFGLVLLMIVVIGMGKIFIAKEKKVAAHSDAAKAAIAAVPEAPAAAAPVAAPAAAPAPVAAPAAAPAPAAAAPVAGEAVTAPMPGNILKVNVTPGQAVKEGDVLVVLEAMKMENEILAPKACTVKQVLVSKGSTVDTGATLVVLG